MSTNNYMKDFKAKETAEKVVSWIQNYFKENGPNCKAVVGISGGKDSSVVAALCAKALGKENVVGVLMPCGEQADINYSHEICDFLGINKIVVDIKPMVDAAMNMFNGALQGELSDVTTINTPPRLRMTTLYGISGTVGGRVANTCNLSEDWVGYSTKFGDSAGDFSPLMHFTVEEVIELGRALGVPDKFLVKVPTDGLCGKTDEENLGFTYAVLGKYIRTGVCEDAEVKAKIDRLHKINMHKLLPMPSYENV